ncbi:hypothetical protein IAU59_007632 [Kwoniella sp. CBS 9459]
MIETHLIKTLETEDGRSTVRNFITAVLHDHPDVGVFIDPAAKKALDERLVTLQRELERPLAESLSGTISDLLILPANNSTMKQKAAAWNRFQAAAPRYHAFLNSGLPPLPLNAFTSQIRPSSSQEQATARSSLLAGLSMWAKDLTEQGDVPHGRLLGMTSPDYDGTARSLQAWITDSQKHEAFMTDAHYTVTLMQILLARLRLADAIEREQHELNGRTAWISASPSGQMTENPGILCIHLVPLEVRISHSGHRGQVDDDIKNSWIAHLGGQPETRPNVIIGCLLNYEEHSGSSSSSMSSSYWSAYEIRTKDRVVYLYDWRWSLRGHEAYRFMRSVFDPLIPHAARPDSITPASGDQSLLNNWEFICRAPVYNAQPIHNEWSGPFAVKLINILRMSSPESPEGLSRFSDHLPQEPITRDLIASYRVMQLTTLLEAHRAAKRLYSVVTEGHMLPQEVMDLHRKAWALYEKVTKNSSMPDEPTVTGDGPAAKRARLNAHATSTK